MSQKSLRVTVEPLPKAQEVSMESPTKEVSKKRSAKEDKKAAAVAKDTPAVSTSTATNGDVPPVKEAEPKQDPTAVAVNGKSKKDKKEPNIDKNGDKAAPVTNGVADVALNAGVAESGAATVSGVAPTAAELNPDIIEDDAMVQTTEQDNDELFPELNYDETSDNECQFDTASPNFSPVGRSATRRSQAKKIPTPETPQLPSAKSDTPELGVSPSPSRATPDTATPLREKIFKMKEAYTPISVSPCPNPAQERLGQDSESEDDPKNRVTPTEEVGSAKTDTNFSKSRIKVSPYRRSSRISEQYSIVANYSGNNSTQQTEVIGDISSSSRDPSENGEQSGDCSAGERSFSDSFKNIKGRRSYRHLREISLRNLSAQRHHHREEEDNTEIKDVSISSVNATNGGSICDTVSSESSAKWTPVGHVVGRKRRNESSEREEHPLPPHPPSPALLLGVGTPAGVTLLGERPTKRQRLLGYVSTPLRQLREKMASSTPIQCSSRISYKADPMLAPSAEETITTEELMIADIVPLAKEGGPEHKWCSIM